MPRNRTPGGVPAPAYPNKLSGIAHESKFPSVPAAGCDLRERPLSDVTHVLGSWALATPEPGTATTASATGARIGAVADVPGQQERRSAYSFS
jgi:hypothetical protein